jgi:hypothetical protein
VTTGEVERAQEQHGYSGSRLGKVWVTIMDRDDRPLDLGPSLLDPSATEGLSVEAKARARKAKHDEREQHSQLAPDGSGPWREEHDALADATVTNAHHRGPIDHDRVSLSTAAGITAARAGGAVAHEGASPSPLQADDLSSFVSTTTGATAAVVETESLLSVGAGNEPDTVSPTAESMTVTTDEAVAHEGASPSPLQADDLSSFVSTTGGATAAVVGTASLLSVGGGNGPGAGSPTTKSMTVTTDKADYAPGSTATFIVADVNSGSSVAFQIADLASDPGINGIADVYAPFSATDGGLGDSDGLANGVVVAKWQVPVDGSATGATLQLTATSGSQTAITTFSDASDTPAD